MNRQTAVELAQKGIVDGKTLQEWMDAPAGKFAKAVRETGVDPLFGLREPLDPDAAPKTFEVTIEYRWRGSASKTYTVTATCEEDAEKEAQELFKNDTDLECDDVDDWEISDVDEVAS